MFDDSDVADHAAVVLNLGNEAIKVGRAGQTKPALGML